MNTKVNLCNRDAANFKVWGVVVFAGEPTAELVARARATFDGPVENDSIICQQVGVDGPTFGGCYADDDAWVEVHEIEATDREPTDDRTFEEFVAVLEATAEEGWDPAEYDPVALLLASSRKGHS